MLQRSKCFVLRRPLIFAVSALAAASLAFAAKPAQAVTPNNAKFVNQMFRDLVLRPATPTEIAYWAHQLDKGETRQEVSNHIQRLNVHRYQQVRRIFDQLIGRLPEKEEIDQFAGELIAGSTLDHVTAEIMALDEYYFGPGGGTDGGFVDAVFLFGTGSYPNATDKAAFVALLQGRARETVARMIFSTDESRDHMARLFYKKLCRRPAEDSEAIYYSSILANQRLETMVGEMMATDDYWQYAITHN